MQAPLEAQTTFSRLSFPTLKVGKVATTLPFLMKCRLNRAVTVAQRASGV